MKNLVKKTAAGVFVAGLTFGFAPAAFAADAAPACYDKAVEKAEVAYSVQVSKLTQLQVESKTAAGKLDRARYNVEQQKKVLKKAEEEFNASKTDQAPAGDATKKAAVETAKAELQKVEKAMKIAFDNFVDAKKGADLQEGTVKNYAYPAYKKVMDADPAAYNKAHGCPVAAPAKPDQKPGKAEVKPGKDVKVDTKAENTKKDSKKAPVKVTKSTKSAKGELAHTGAVAASLAGLAVASVAGGTGVVAWRRRKA